MREKILLGLLVLSASISALAKSATVHFTIKNFKGTITIYNPELRYDLTKNKVTYLHPNAQQSEPYTMSIDKPTFLVLDFLSDKAFNCSLFVSPGDDIFFDADFARKKNMVITGRGSNNNQPEVFALTNMDAEPFKGDKAPDRVIAAIRKQYVLDKKILANYIQANRPSPAFVENAKINLKYFVPFTYYEFYHNNNFNWPKETLEKWQKVQDSIFTKVKLDNGNGLLSYNYTRLIDNFIVRETEEAWMESESSPRLFYKKWYHADPVRGRKLSNEAHPAILTEKIIDKYLTGKASEYAYCELLKHEHHEADYQAMILIFGHFKKKHATSPFIKVSSGVISEIAKKQSETLSSKMTFFLDNGTKLNTFKEVLALLKHKLVLVDMWGTWCGPCRQDIERNEAQLRAHFKGRNVVFLYIANYDIGREKEWKRLIAYFQIEGEHILANKRLTEDIMKTVKGSGFPTYIIVRKDGTYKKAATQYPANAQAMIKELEAADRL